MLDQSTICAISTSPGVGAIAIIRLSGNDAILISDKIFKSPKKGKVLIEQPANTIHFGQIKSVFQILIEVFRFFF